MRKTLVLTLLALALSIVPPTSASHAEGTIEDPQGDVVPQEALALAPPDTVPEEMTPEEIGQVGDVLGAAITSESANAFSITVTLDDIPDHDENVSTPIAEVWAHFDVKGQTYHAAAVLAMPPEDGKLEARYDLYRGSSALGQMQGTVDRLADTVTFVVDKASVGFPVFGDQLTKFYVTTHVPDTELILDYAPDTEPFDPEGLDPFNPDLLGTAKYGASYTFGKYNGAVPSDLDVSVTPSSLQLQAGQQGTVSVSVKNSAPVEDTVTLATGNVPAGWSVRFDANQVNLDPGQSRLVTLFVVPAGSANGQSLVTLRLLSSLGADQESALSVQVTQPPPRTTSPPPSSSPPASGSPGSGGAVTPAAQPADSGEGAAEEEKGSPFPAPAALLAAIGAAAVVARRRRG